MRKKLFKWFQILISLLFVYLFLNKIKLGDLSTYLINIKWNYGHKKRDLLEKMLKIICVLYMNQIVRQLVVNKN